MTTDWKTRAAATMRDGILPLLDTAHPDTRRIWTDLINEAPVRTTASEFLNAWDVNYTSVMSRFVRAGLPSLKECLVSIRLCYVASFFDQTGKQTIQDAAFALHYASAQALGRHLRKEMDMTVGRFRDEVPFNQLFLGERLRLIVVHRERWLTLNPFLREAP